ncbi:MAG: hypothetical protein HDQ44_02670 [Desulfovibrio sp.]|nr:hypothetical protein [Desulfovibrio sp.]
MPTLKRPTDCSQTAAILKACALCCLLFASVLLQTGHAAEESLINIAPERPAGLAPGMLLVLPDGRRAAIQEQLPDGNYNTDVGVVISPAGVIVEGPLKGEQVILPKTVALPEAQQEPGAAPEPEPKEPRAEAAKTPEQKQRPDEQLTIVELLPMTTLPDAAKKAPVKPDQPEKQAAPQKQQPPKKPEQAAKKAPEPQKPAKPANGQELRIPPEAAKTGNLSFLEGCWQGTRPEYYSKRTIRECFCFGANGKTGKRRVYDPQGGRMCIGSSRATLSKAGVLSVTSSGAACNDGQRWGQAEMVCRNSGPKTPCSWVFRDAQNGHQSYQIPFVRVESCGR